MPNSKWKNEEIKHSFSDSYGSGQNPPELKQVEAGYLGIGKIIAEDRARRAAEKAERKRRRALRLKRKRARRYYEEKKARMAVDKPPKHPALSVAESVALAEAMQLA